jgi:nucleoid DNA-binding protein
MNKKDLVEAVAAVTDSRKQAQAAVDCVFASITDALKAGDAVQLTGFGSFKVSDRAARKGRNPQTGEAIDIAARKVAKFSAGKALKDALN